MKNIINVAKYSFKSLRIVYIIEAVLVFLGFVLGAFISIFTGGIEGVGAIAVYGTVNFIAYIAIFSIQLSKEHGRLLFTAPIKSYEFIAGNFLGLLLTQLALLGICCIWPIINSRGTLIPLLTGGGAIILGLTVAYIIITSLIIICGSYIKKTSLTVFAVILVALIGSSIYQLVVQIILRFLPYVYISFTGSIFTEIDVLSVIIDFIALVLLQGFAIYRLEKNFDIV